MGKSVVIIGSGFASLSAACFLARDGYSVTVLEKNEGPGGRCRVWENEGFRFDMGPSWYWMPDVFESFFARFNKKPSDYYRLTRLSPSYRVFFKGDERWDIPANTGELAQLLEQHEKGAAEKLASFLKEAEYKYNTGMKELVYKPGRSLSEFADTRLLKGILKLDVFKSMKSHVAAHFSHPNIVQLMEFPVLFLGAKPAKTPALYSLMNYADIQLGTWYPMGGMYEIVKAMHCLALELGVQFRFNSEVKDIVVRGGIAKSAVTADGFYPADILLAGADYYHIDRQVLKNGHRSYSESYWNKRTMAPSSLIFYLGVNKKLKNLQHHNLFFDEDFNRHASEIYDNPQWPANPLFYVSVPSQTDAGVAPHDCENLFVLIPVAPGLNDSAEIRDKYYNLVMQRLEQRTGQDIRSHVTVKRSYAHNDFSADYHAFKGNAYGLANTLRQTAILKPSVKSKKINNLFYTGQLTVPGPGVPPSLISGQVVANEISKEFPLKA